MHARYRNFIHEVCVTLTERPRGGSLRSKMVAHRQNPGYWRCRQKSKTLEYYQRYE